MYLFKILEVDELLVGLEAQAAKLQRVKIPILTLARSVWRKTKKVVGYTDTPWEIPIWNNPNLEQLKIFMTVTSGNGRE